MTIKKRLFISNILMFIVPFVVSMATIWLCMLILNVLTHGALWETIGANREAMGVQREDPSTQMVILLTILFIGFCVVIFFTNLFLTKFLFKKIKQPLEQLSSGVNKISEGKLDYKIEYNENDEF